MESSSSTPRVEGLGRRLPSVPCKQCKRRQMPWKGTNPRIKPYAKADNTCEHQSGSGLRPTCLRCYSHLRKDDHGFMSCPDPDCRGLFSIGPHNPPYSSIPPYLNPNVPAKEPDKPRKSQPPLILRTHCRNCRLGDEVCSGLIFGLRCERCEALDLECDCKVLRKSCEECMKDRGKVGWKRCAGLRDECDACIEKEIECKEYIREPGKGVIEEKPPQDVVADGTMDVIDGMKAARAFTACERCLEEKLRCDESLPGCGGCRVKGVECKYRLLTVAFSWLSGRKLEQRRSSLSHQEKFEQDNPDEVATRRSRIPLTCVGCRESKTKCSGVFPCDLCEKLGLYCIPDLGKSTPDHGAIRANEVNTKIGDNIEQLEGMMSDLELEGWHLVSREEIEEIGRFESDRE